MDVLIFGVLVSCLVASCLYSGYLLGLRRAEDREDFVPRERWPVSVDIAHGVARLRRVSTPDDLDGDDIERLVLLRRSGDVVVTYRDGERSVFGPATGGTRHRFGRRNADRAMSPGRGS